MQASDTIVLNYLDLPPRILLWPVSEVMMVCMPGFIFFVFGFVGLGILSSILMGCVIKIFKRFFGTGYLNGVMYWYLPTSIEQFPVTPPSYIRTFIN
ncbi:MAG: hypothetical protein FADNKDHG_01500 [Holosporales bacterium]